MPELATRAHCTGCQACKYVCPKKCIDMEPDHTGSLYPKVDLTRCIECKACERVCPALHAPEFRFPQKAYAAWNTDEAQRQRSASGGIAAAIYMWLKRLQGVSVGAIVEKDWKVKIVVLEPEDSFVRCANSKYVYSDPLDTYTRIRGYIKKGREVVLIGLPCQIAGYRKFFGEHDNLTYVDLVCHGVAPASYLPQHIRHLENLIGLNAEDMSFRAPEKGTSTYHFTLYDKNGNLVYSRRSSDGDSYNIAFHRGYSYRENCYHCHYARPERVSDLTIGDYHGLGRVKPCEFSEENVSMILVNTSKGVSLLRKLEDAEFVTLHERPVEEPIAGDSQLRHPTRKSREREDFEEWILKNDGDFERTVEKVLLMKMKREQMEYYRHLPGRIVNKLFRILMLKK